MRKLSVSLKESRFVDLINKKFTGEIRKEDKIGNLKELKPVDIETSVLWADVDLRDGDNYLFTFDEVTDMLKDSEWRLPITFYPHGFIYDPLPSKETAQGPNNDDTVYGWTNDVSKYNNNNINIYLMGPSLFIDGKSNAIYKNSLLSARLVKDR